MSPLLKMLARVLAGDVVVTRAGAVDKRLLIPLFLLDSPAALDMMTEGCLLYTSALNCCCSVTSIPPSLLLPGFGTAHPEIVGRAERCNSCSKGVWVSQVFCMRSTLHLSHISGSMANVAMWPSVVGFSRDCWPDCTNATE